MLVYQFKQTNYHPPKSPSSIPKWAPVGPNCSPTAAQLGPTGAQLGPIWNAAWVGLQRLGWRWLHLVNKAVRLTC